MSFTKLDPSIIDSSLWAEPPETRVVWITMLAKCDADGYVRMSLSGLQRAANLDMSKTRLAIETLEAPDPESRTSGNEGRRVIKVEGGWHVLNYLAYRNNAQNQAVREYFAEQKRKQREKESKTCPRHVPDPSASASASASVPEGGTGGIRQKGGCVTDTSRIKEVFEAWNGLGSVPKCLLVSDKIRRSLQVRLREPFFIENWKPAMQRVVSSCFCRGENERGWRASFDWFITPDAVRKIMEGKYDNQPRHQKAKEPEKKSFWDKELDAYDRARARGNV